MPEAPHVEGLRAYVGRAPHKFRTLRVFFCGFGPASPVCLCWGGASPSRVGLPEKGLVDFGFFANFFFFPCVVQWSPLAEPLREEGRGKTGAPHEGDGEKRKERKKERRESGQITRTEA